MKLKDVYITWNDTDVRVVPKSDGVPPKDGVVNHPRGYEDPSEWDLPAAEFFLEEFTSLTTGGCDPEQVDREFSKIDEYREMEDRALEVMEAMHRKRQAA